MKKRVHMESAFLLGTALALALSACQQPAPVRTPTPLSDGSKRVEAPLGKGSAPPANELVKPDNCNSAPPGTLQEITGTRASPYFVVHPAQDSSTAPTVIFLSGGSGSRRSAQRVWTNYLSRSSAREAFRIVVPYAVDMEYIDEAGRTFGILSEVLECYGGDPARVHIGGVSNGGVAAFMLMLARPQRFATLLGAPGTFPITTKPEAWGKALAGHPVFNGIGANDVDWKPNVKATHEALAAMGLDSVYVEFPDQGHTVNQSFDNRILFDFWAKHSR